MNESPLTKTERSLINIIRKIPWGEYKLNLKIKEGEPVILEITERTESIRLDLTED